MARRLFMGLVKRPATHQLALSGLPQGHAFHTLVLRHRGGDCIYDVRCLFVTLGLNALVIVLPHWDNMSLSHMLTHRLGRPVMFRGPYFM